MTIPVVVRREWVLLRAILVHHKNLVVAIQRGVERDVSTVGRPRRRPSIDAGIGQLDLPGTVNIRYVDRPVVIR